MDQSLVKDLGPFARALSRITGGAEWDKDNEEKDQGQMMLFRGSQMNAN